MSYPLHCYYNGPNKELRGCVNDVNGIIEKIEALISDPPNFYVSPVSVVASSNMFSNYEVATLIYPQIFKFMHDHICEKHYHKNKTENKFNGFLISNNVHRNQMVVSCSCGESWPLYKEIRLGRFYGETFDEFLSEINWAYDFIINKADLDAYSIRRSEVEKTKVKANSLKYTNPISSLEV